MAAGRAIVATGATAASRGRRRRAFRIGGVVILVVLLAAGVIGIVHRSQPREAQVCAADGSACATMQASGPRDWALLPIGSSGRLRVHDDAAAGAVGIGVVGYLDAAPAHLLPRTSTTGSVAVPQGATRTVRLSGVPDGARFVLLRTDGVTAASSGCAGQACNALRVAFSPLVASPGTAVITRLLEARTALTTAVARRTGGSVADELHTRAAAPAHLTAAIRPGHGQLTVDWLLTSGGQDVTAVRVAIRPAGAGEHERIRNAIAASGSLVLAGLDTSTRYVVDVAPVVSTDGKHVAGAAVELSGVPDGAPTAAGATTPSAPAGWTPLIDQDFSKPAALGHFADVYPGWSWYDGMTETSRETARPSGEVGVWNSATTMSVSDGMLDCYLHTAGKQPQVCALTPTPTDQIWHGQRYGRYSVRFRADAIPGYKIAWLLWPDSDDWSQGEIDFPEAELDGTITGSSHRNDGDPSDFAWFVDTATGVDAWHTATIDWEPGRLTFVLDGESWTTTDPAALPRVPMRWTLQAESDIQATPPDPAVHGHILIDWVAAWSRD